MYDMRFKVPSKFFIAGSSESGKTTFVFNVLKNGSELFNNPKCLQNVIFFYNEWQSKYEENDNLVTEWINQVPTADIIAEKTRVFKDNGGSIVIIDDFAQELPKEMKNVFGVMSHHLNFVVMVLTQNLFPRGNVADTFHFLSRNSTYKVIFKSPRDQVQIRYLAQQFNPQNIKYVMESVDEALKDPHSYILFDFHQKTPDHLRLRSKVLPTEAPMHVWAEKTCNS